jgi:hypothetical protein
MYRSVPRARRGRRRPRDTCLPVILIWPPIGLLFDEPKWARTKVTGSDALCLSSDEGGALAGDPATAALAGLAELTEAREETASAPARAGPAVTL